MTISVIVPVLNEERVISAAITALQEQPEVLEVIVVDGGSDDNTLAELKRFPELTVIASQRGRAQQMNAGAQRASGEILLFLHADVRLPPNAMRWVREVLHAKNCVAGAFRTHTVVEEATSLWSPLLRLADMRSRYTRYPYGDQALFVRKTIFHTLGGFRPQQLMEDIELSRRLWAKGTVSTARACVQVSGRRFAARPLFYAAVMNAFPLLYRLGVSPQRLHRWYGNIR